MSKTMEDFKLRTIESLKRDNPVNNDDKERRQGRLHAPLLNIKINNIIPDELHLLLRITDILTRNLINAAMTHDEKERTRIKNPLERPMIKQLLENINKCGVTFRIRLNEGKGFDFTSLTGGDKLKLLSKLPSYLMESQPIAFANDVKLLWEVISCNNYFNLFIILIFYYRILMISIQF